MTRIDTPEFCKWLFKETPQRVEESCNRLHFYFVSEYGITSCSYSKMELIRLLYKNIR